MKDETETWLKYAAVSCLILSLTWKFARDAWPLLSG